MKLSKKIKIALAAATVFFAACCPIKQGADTQVLINGEAGLDNWVQLGNANWHGQDGAIVAESGEGFLVSKQSYADFRLVIEFWADHTTNSGVFIRMSDSVVVNSDNAYEVNIFDQRPDPLYGTGAIVDVAKVDPMPKSGGQWNTYEIIANGDHLIARLNGVETANANNSKHAGGPIGLQFGSVPSGKPGAIKWRKVSVEAL